MIVASLGERDQPGMHEVSNELMMQCPKVWRWQRPRLEALDTSEEIGTPIFRPESSFLEDRIP